MKTDKHEWEFIPDPGDFSYTLMINKAVRFETCL